MAVSMSTSNIRHEFLAIDEGLGQLLHVDERDPSRDWTVPLGQPQVRDMQLIGEGRLLISHHHGYSEFDIHTGARVKDFASLVGVTSARRQADGSTWLAGENLDGETGVVILELDERDKRRKATCYPGNYVRLIRQTEQGTCLMCCNARIREGAPDGTYVHDIEYPGFIHAWKAVRLANGHYFVSAGYGAFCVEVDAQGGLVRKLGGVGQLSKHVNPFFFGMFQLLPQGHVVLANWQGHGPGHGLAGVQLLEFNHAGAVVWQWSEAARISSVQGVLVLDGLDVSRLHDEREGLMTPVTETCEVRKR